MSEYEKANLIFLDAIERQLGEIKKIENTLLKTFEDLKMILGRKRSFKMVPERNSRTKLIEEVTITEETATTQAPTMLTGPRTCPHCGGAL